jgi:DsbC/DsbD-like thiol-disulfide interchange protein
MRASTILVLKSLLALLLAVLAVQPAPAQQATHIKAELLLAESTASADGGRLETYALHFTPDPGWHGYWVNPGDAGYGLRLEWDIPADWIGDAEYPVPQTLLIQGLMNHVYERDYAALVPVRVPPSETLCGGAAPGLSFNSTISRSPSRQKSCGAA